MTKPPDAPRLGNFIQTGIAGLDDILNGGLLANRLYLAERLAGPDGEGIVHVFELMGAELVFADGFEGGDTGAWSAETP